MAGGCLAITAACGGAETAPDAAMAPPDSAATTAAPVTIPAAPDVTAMREPATVGTPADRVDEPLTVHWIGGSDVAWNETSLPDALLADLPSFGERPIVVRARTVQAVMPVGMRELFDAAVTGGADAIVMSINPVWLHWDGIACLDDPGVPYDFYRCLLTPISATVTAQRAQELTALFSAAAASGVPVYAYTQPHSAEVLADASLGPSIAAAETALAAFDPGVPNVRFRSRIFTRDTAPMREGVEFFDMVHPTPAGATAMSDWLANDLADFWRTAGVASSFTP